MPKLQQRKAPPSSSYALIKSGVHPLLARMLASRGLQSREDLGEGLGQLLHHSLLKGAAEAAAYLADCIEKQTPILVIADYDCDGATACATAVRGLKSFGANVQYVVPDRMIHGYGLTEGVVKDALIKYPDTKVLLTVDNGVASHAGVDYANSCGLEVVVTDHHLPSKLKPLPAAKVIVDHAQPGCLFPAKTLAGVGVIWYVLWALQDELRSRGLPPSGFKVSDLLGLVAVGTVADVVPLDKNNRILVKVGIEKIRAGHSFAGIEALATVGVTNKTRIEHLRTSDIAFGIGPRINAAGRLKSMDIGINCLLADDPEQAKVLAAELDAVNQERKDVELGIVTEATKQAEPLVEEGKKSIVVFHPGWHVGVVGIVAGRIKEKRYRPTFVLTKTDSGELKGSGRSIPGFNLKDALDQVDKQAPGLMPKFGGHAMAAGVSIRADGLELFKELFEAQAKALLTDEMLNQVLEHDGELTGLELTSDTCFMLGEVPWGQNFLEPAFHNTFVMKKVSRVGANKDQLNFELELDGVAFKATKFRHSGDAPAGPVVSLVYKLAGTYDKWGKPQIKLLIDEILN